MNQMSKKRTMVVIAGIMLGMLLGALDQTIVGTAMPRIIALLGGMNLYAWVFTAYMLTSTTSVPIMGKLSDLYGRKPFYIGGIVVFMLGSALSGAAQTMTQLIIFRGLQGLGAGTMMSNSMAIVGDLFPPAERGKWQGVMGAVFGISSVIGPTLGGFITDNLNWRWVFYVNLPVGLLAVAVLLVALPNIKNTVKRSIDYLGVATLVAAVVPMLLAFVWGGEDYAWTSPVIIGLLAFSAASWAAFVAAERHAEEPILPLTLFKNSIFSVSAAVVFLTGIGMFGAINFIPLFVQGVIGTSATNSGMILTPMMLGMIVSSTLAGQLISRLGRYRAISLVGLAAMGLGMFLLSQMGVHTSNALVVRNMIVLGLGLGVTMPIYVITVQNSVSYDKLGVVTSSIQFFRSIGGTIGVAIMGSFLTSRLSTNVMASLPAQVKQMVPPDRLNELVNPKIFMNPQATAQMQNQLSGPMAELFRQVMEAVRSALALSLHGIFLAAFVILVLSFGINLMLKEIPLRRSHRPTPEEAQQSQPGKANSPAASPEAINPEVIQPEEA
ncbi:MAG: MFS transporter [Firmicutes bacterium]|nr:MFS transporter [Bacillota bacterium]